MKISIITPVYNGEKYIEETIKSVLNQKGDYELEYIVIDGMSTDNTNSIIEQYYQEYRKGKYKDNFLALNFIYISEKDGGMYDALRKGFLRCTGDVVGWINSDDFYVDGAFEKVCGVFNDCLDVNWITGRCNVINKSMRFEWRSLLRYYPKRFILNGMFGRFSNIFIPQESTFWRRELLENIDLNIFANYKLAGDYYLWFKFANSNDLYSVDEDLAVFRSTGVNLSTDKAGYRGEMREIMNYAYEISDRERILFRSYSEMRKNNEERKDVYFPYICKREKKWEIIDERSRKYRENIIVSIVTVCRNEKNIRYTCESIVNQTWGNYEWIVIDGASTDGTLDIIKEYEDSIDKLISEPDYGIYNAMNKGIRCANGEWIIFMNGGDQFHDFRILERIFQDKEYNCEVLYGNEERYDRYGKNSIYVMPDVIPKYFMCYRSFAHQAMFYRKEIFDKYGLYDESYRISGDSEKNTQLLLAGVKFQKINDIVSSYILDGLSNDKEQYQLFEDERKKRRLKYYSEKEVELYQNGVYKSDINIKVPIIKIKSFRNGKTKKYYLFGIFLLFIAERVY